MPIRTYKIPTVLQVRGAALSSSALIILCLIIFLWVLRSLPWEVIPAYSQDRQAFYLLDIRDNQSWILPSNPEPRVPATKPPLLAWISTVLSYLLGVNAFSLRIPSLLASVGCLLLIYLYSKK
jgi:4-amino-4-deoxy-L-arabinose transferase-like glycosyltransferase